MGEMITNGRSRRTDMSNGRVRAAALCAASAMLLAGGRQAARAAGTVPSDTQYQFSNATGSFSTGFTPTFTTDPNGELNFGGTAYTATDDIAAASVNNLTFSSTGLITVAGANTLTLTNNTAGNGPSIVVGAGGASIADILAGTNGFNLSGGGTLTLATNADTGLTGNVVVNNSTLTLNIAQAASTAFYLNGGGLTTSNAVPLATTNSIYVASGTSTFATADATFNALFYGNGNLNYNSSTALNTPVYNGAASTFSNFGGSINWGANNNGIRIIASTGSATSFNPFANFNLGSGSAGLSTRNGTQDIVLGGLASTSATAGIGGAGSSGGHDNLWVVGSANIASETFAGGIFTSAQAPNSFLKTGTGLLAFTGVSTAIDTAGTAGAAYQAPGTYNVYGGTLQLNFSTNASNLLPVTTAFGMAQGGTLSLLGNSSSNSSQTFAGLGTTVGTGGAAIVMNANGAGRTMTLNLGAITATAAGSVLNVSTTGTGTDVVTTTNGVLGDGSYGARITYGSGFATTTSGSSPFTLSTYTPATAFTGADASNINYLLTGSGSTAATDSVNSLTVASATGTAQALTLGANLTLTNGGFLYNGSDSYSVTGTGALASTATDLIVQQLGAGTLTISVPIASSGAGTFTKAGTGTVVLAGANTYTGQTYLDGGVTSISSDANLGAVGTGATLNLESGTLQATATFGLFNGAAGTNNRAVVIGGGGGTLDVTANNTLTIAGVVSNTTIGAQTTSLYGPLTKTDSGTLVLSGNNTYAGATIITGGTLSVAALALGNVASGIGQSPGTANALIINGATLQYTGAGNTTDRDFTLGQNGATIDVVNTTTSPLAFSSLLPIATTGSGTRTLTLTSSLGSNGSPSGLGGSLGMQIVDGTGGSTSLAVSGTKWTLSNPNHTYTGTTTVSNGGTLALSASTTSNPIAASSTITAGVTSGSTAKLDVTGLAGGTLALAPSQTLAGTGTVAGSVAVGNLSVLAPGSSTSPVDTLSISNGLTLNNGSISNFELVSQTSGDLVNVAALTLNGTDGINLYQVGGTSKFTTDGTYNLFNISSSSLTGLTSSLSVLNPATNLTYLFGTANGTSGNEFVTVTIGGTSVISSAWAVDASGSYDTATNWSPQAVPNAIGATATFGNVPLTQPRTVTAGAADTVGEIDFNSAVAYTLAADGGNDPITLNNSPTPAAPTAAIINDINGSHTISVPLTVTAGSGSASNPGLAITIGTAGNVLTLSGPIGEASGSAALTKAGAGTLALFGINSFTGGTTINNGVVQINNAFSLGATAGTAAFNSSAFAVTLEATASITSGRNFTLNGTNNTIQVDGSGTYEIDGVISDAASTTGNSLTKTGSGTLALAGGNTFTGPTTISAGTLALGNGTAAGGFVTGSIVDNSALSLNRPLNDDYSLGTVVSGTGTLTQNGGDNVTLTAANTFTGNTVVAAGTLTLGNALALQDSTLNYSSQGGVLSFGTLTAATLGALSGTQSLALTNIAGAPAAVALTVGGTNATTSYTGTLGGLGSLVKNGSGTFTVGSGATGGATYGGATTVLQGSLVIGGVSSLTGAVDITGQNGASALTFQDTAVLNSTATLFVTGPSTQGFPTPATLVVKNSASVTALNISFGDGAAGGGPRPAVGDAITVQDSASVIANGFLDFLNTNGGTTTSSGTTVNLNGGTLAVQKFQLTNAGNGTTTAAALRLNGGTLEALASDTSPTAFFLPAITKLTADVDTGGAFINNNGFGITFAQALVHGTGTTDGGLTSSGVGSLTLAGVNTYNGVTTVSAGTLALAPTTATDNNIASSSKVVVKSGATLNVSAVNTGPTGLFALASGQVLAGSGTVTGPFAVTSGSTITGGTGATVTDTLGTLTSGVQTWSTGGTYAVKLDGSHSTVDPTGTGKSGPGPASTGPFANDTLVFSNLSVSSTGLTVNPVFVTSGAASFAAGAYSYVIADATASTTPNSTTAFDGLALSSIVVPANYSLSTMPDTGSGEDLLLNFTAAPEPTSLLLAGLAAVPLVLGRRRQRTA